VHQNMTPTEILSVERVLCRFRVYSTTAFVSQQLPLLVRAHWGSGFTTRKSAVAAAVVTAMGVAEGLWRRLASLGAFFDVVAEAASQSVPGGAMTSIMAGQG